MRDLYLHIGLHKTGTSHLQKLFQENHELLLAAGLGMGPYQDPPSGSHHPIIAALEKEGAEAVFARAAKAPGEKILISAEQLCTEIRSPALIRDIAEAARRHFNVKIVIFLRRQDYLKESIYSQTVKHWYTGDILSDNHYNLDHDGRLRTLELAFGRENIIVRLYRDGGPNDITGAFLDALDLNVDPGNLKDIPRQNVSMHRRKILFMSQVPKTIHDAKKPENGRLARLGFLVRVLERTEAVADDGGRFMMSPAERHDLVAAHQEGNRAIVARYGITNPGNFIETPDATTPWTAPAPITAHERRGVLRAVLAAALRQRNPVRAARLSAHLTELLTETARR